MNAQQENSNDFERNCNKKPKESLFNTRNVLIASGISIVAVFLIFLGSGRFAGESNLDLNPSIAGSNSISSQSQTETLIFSIDRRIFSIDPSSADLKARLIYEKASGRTIFWIETTSDKSRVYFESENLQNLSYIDASDGSCLEKIPLSSFYLDRGFCLQKPVSKGIYFVSETSGVIQIEYYEFATKTKKVVADNPCQPSYIPSIISQSSDGSKIFYRCISYKEQITPAYMFSVDKPFNKLFDMKKDQSVIIAPYDIYAIIFENQSNVIKIVNINDIPIEEFEIQLNFSLGNVISRTFSNDKRTLFIISRQIINGSAVEYQLISFDYETLIECNPARPLIYTIKTINLPAL